MTEEEKKPQEQTGQEIDYVELLQKSEEARKKAEADLAKSRSNEKKWMDSALNSTPKKDEQSDGKEGQSMDDLRKIVFNTDGKYNDLEYTKAALELRKKSIKETGKDPFVPYTSKEYESGVDEAKAERIADVLQECVDAAGDNASVFKAMLTTRLHN